jgi:hypothetical protein
MSSWTIGHIHTMDRHTTWKPPTIRLTPVVNNKPSGEDIKKFLERKGYSSVSEAVRDYC